MIPAARQFMPEHGEINAAVSRITRQPEFAAFQKLCAFLKFIVAESLADRQAQIKVFTIARAVYGREESFNPQTSSLVRVEALRLRGLLDRYYQGQGAGEPLKIQIPRGSYVPLFTLRLPAEGVNDNLHPQASSRSMKMKLPGRTAAAFAIAAAVSATAMFWLASPGTGQAIELVASTFRNTAGPLMATAPLVIPEKHVAN